MEMPKNLALCLVCNKDLGPLNQIPTFYHRPNVLFSRTPATSTLLRHKLESIVKDIVVFRSETCCLCVKCAGLINLADALEAELQSVCRQLSDHYWRTARLRGFGEERAIVCITPLPPKPVTSAADGGGGGAGGVGQRRSGQPPPPPPPLQQQPQQQPPPPPPPLQQMIQHQQQMQQMQQHGVPGQMMMPGWPMHPMAMAQGQAPMGWQPGMAGVAPDSMQGPRPPAYPGMPAAGAGEMADPETEPGRELERSMSQESDDATGVCQLLSAVEVELTEVKQEPGEDADASNHLMREPVDIEVDPWRDLGYEDANVLEKLASKKTRSMPPPSAQSAPVRWPHQPHPPGGGGGHGHGGHGGRQTAVARTTRTYGTGAGPRPEAPRAPGERPAPPPNLPPGAQKTHQRIMKTLTSHSSAIQQAVANGVLSLEVRPPGSAAPPPPPMTRKLSGGSGGKAAGTTSRPLPPLAPALPPKTPHGMDPAQAQATAVAQLASLSSGTNFKIKLPSLTPRDGAASPAAVASPSGAGRPVTPPNEQESPATDGAASASPPEFPGKTIAWFHKSQRLRPGNYTYVKSGDSLNGKLIPIAPTKGRPPRRRANAGPIVRLVVGTPMNKKRYPPLEKALAMVAAAARGGGHPAGRYRVEPRILPKPDVAGPSAPAASAQPASTSASTSDQASTSADQAQASQEETPAEEESEKSEAKEEEAAGEGAPTDPPPPTTPVKRGRGRPRKDGKSPGSVSARRGRPPRRQSPAAAEKRPADESQSSAPPPAKRRRLERPPPESNGRRHSRRLSARLSQMEPEAAEAEAEARSPPPPAEGKAEAMPAADGEAAAEGEGSKDDGSAAAEGQAEAPPDASETEAPPDAPDENGSGTSPAGDAGAAMDDSAPDVSADEPDPAPASDESEKSPAPTAPSESEDGAPAATDAATEAEHIPEAAADP